jgi:antirestriction protein
MLNVEKMNELIENFGEEVIVEFANNFGDHALEYYESYIKARQNLAHFGQEKVDTIIKQFVNYFDWNDIEHIEEAFCGFHDSLVYFAHQMFDEIYLSEIPNHLRSYIDYEKYAQDLHYSGYFFCDDIGAVFNSNF